MDARGVSVANSERANVRGESEEAEKSMEENVVEPEVTSGTPEIVVLEVSQVMTDWMEVTTSATSAGRVVLPTMKQALAWRGTKRGTEVVLLVWLT